MTHVRSVGKCLAAVLPAVLAAGAQSLFAQSVGPFTEAQATHGKEVYARTCAACHGPDLQGAASIPLAGSSFQARWRFPALTVDDLFYIVRKTMPPQAAGAVPVDDFSPPRSPTSFRPTATVRGRCRWPSALRA